ncbi:MULTISPECIES: efflux RND transporter periplasmic adaptor subunit [unclassified Schlesneria]|uniref:efflux RND transporter periplasmic adaptor subunit n=1 Tax=unclassified Schlesneria TaxID=2762017 RepID=UPI002F157C2A
MPIFPFRFDVSSVVIRSLVSRSPRAMVLLAGVLAMGCQKSVPPSKEAPPPVVSVAVPVVEEVQEFEETTGRLVAREAVEIRSRVSGYLDRTFFVDGANVQEDQPLFEIDARPYAAELARASANVEQGRARVDRLKREEERIRKLFGTKNTTQADLDLVSADLAEARAAVDGLIAAREIAELNLEFTKISSPITGRISRRLVDPGNLVKADETPLVTVMSLNPIYAYFDIDERTVLRVERLIREGKIPSPRDSKYHVSFALADETEFTRTGEIDFLDNHISATTGTLRLRATVENDNLLLQPGMFIRLHVPIGNPHPALLIPEEALGSDQGQRYVYVVNDEDVVTYRRVKIGLLKEGRRVIEEGLGPEDRVIVSGLQRARVGIKVNPELVAQKSPESAASPASEGKSVPAKSIERKPESGSTGGHKAVEAKATTDVLGRP